MLIEQMFYIINDASATYLILIIGPSWIGGNMLAVMLFHILKDYNDYHQSEISFDSITPDIIPKGNF